MDKQLVQDCMTLITCSGEGKALATEAFNLILSGDKYGAEAKLKEAGKSIGEAHNIQTRLIEEELNGIIIEKTILLIHAQDQFMTSVTYRDMVKLIIELYQKVREK
ncbi:PTS system, cellobiose-specific IIA component [Clostridium acidisoli DSM 12555]|uniref:PTS system, cellobiose-specific IIA component n=1 Tax=Clostridium acidisoli DSM 12555 TaxID=1121291 RepID=A0A1W1XL32_9CLOT|nr:PTS lactose/cellobiose transporter subunit IIA [Clostridium acidisoli]SMC24683.1 PTS system, cellobiose-specific IIA component [Clostridium acidisoli DSM 12555]